MSDEHDTVQVRSKKYSFLTLIKLVFAAWLITWIMNGGSYFTVFMNHAMAKGIGIAEDALDFCAACWSSIG